MKKSKFKMTYDRSHPNQLEPKVNHRKIRDVLLVAGFLILCGCQDSINVDYRAHAHFVEVRESLDRLAQLMLDSGYYAVERDGIGVVLRDNENMRIGVPDNGEEWSRLLQESDVIAISSDEYGFVLPINLAQFNPGDDFSMSAVYRYVTKELPSKSSLPTCKDNAFAKAEVTCVVLLDDKWMMVYSWGDISD